MTVAWLVLAAAVVVPAAAAAAWAGAARRARRQLVDALAAVAEVAGVVPPGEGRRRSETARLLAAGLGVDRRSVRRVGDAVRLAGLSGLVPAASAVDAAGGALRVATQSEVPRQTTALLHDALTADGGGGGSGVAAARVALTYHAACAAAGMAPAGALFATAARHATGDERRAAELLVQLVQGGPSPA